MRRRRGRSVFADRDEAGVLLAERLAHLAGEDLVVLGLPRGGVPVAARVAAALGAPLDVIVVRKLGVPQQPELAMGAIGEDGVRVVDDEVLAMARVDGAALAAVEARERAELERRAARFRGGRAAVPLAGRIAVVVDDGIATGSTARAACRVARAHGAARVVLAVPVAPPDWTARFAGVADELVSLATPTPFLAVGQWYEDFSQTTDEEVLEHLARASGAARGGGPVGPPPSGPRSTPLREEVCIPAGGVTLQGDLVVPPDPRGVVLFVHGSGSSRHSPRNRSVAAALADAGFATLLFDLLTPAEEAERRNVFDVELLAGRLAAAITWLRGRPDARSLRLGLFGASTGAAAALRVAAEPEAGVSAVVSRGGRPDLAGRWLASVSAPTLLVVGGEDRAVLALNREARAHLRGESALDVVAGATHLFEEPGTLETVAGLAVEWFERHLGPPGAAGS